MTGGSTYPRSYSDIQCGVCFRYFRLEGELMDHQEAEHV